MKLYLRVAVALVVVFAIMGFLTRHEPRNWLSLLMAAAACTLIVVATTWGRSRDLLRRYPRQVRGVGYGLMAFGIALIFLLVAYMPGFAQTAIGGSLPLLGIMLGTMLVVLPRSVARSDEQRAAPTEAPLAAGVFDGTVEARMAIGLVFSRAGTFWRMAWPWLLPIWLAPLCAVWIDGPDRDAVQLIRVLLETAIFLLASALAVPVVATAWHRYVFDGTTPRFAIALPSLTSLRYLGRLIVPVLLFNAFGRLLLSNWPDLVRAVGLQPADAILQLAYYLLLLLFAFAGSPYALAFPALVAGDAQSGMHASLRRQRRLGRTYATGFAATLLPFIAVLAVIGQAQIALHVDPFGAAGIAADLASDAFFLFGIAAAATYLTRAYVASGP